MSLFLRAKHMKWLCRASSTHIRSTFKGANTIVIKLGTTVITNSDGCGLALGRLASIVEQISELQNSRKKIILITSGSVAFGRQKLLQESLMSQSVRQAIIGLESQNELMKQLGNKASAAVGQCGLMFLYESIFQQYSVKVAQVLLTAQDLTNELRRFQVSSTLRELMSRSILPIINTNDAVNPESSSFKIDNENFGELDNDILAALIAKEMSADLLILMSNVDGLYSGPPNDPNTRIIDYVNPAEDLSRYEFFEKSSVGMGGMSSKLKSACWAVREGTNAVICNGMKPLNITKIIQGRKVGTLLSMTLDSQQDTENTCAKAKTAGKKLQNLAPGEKKKLLNEIADVLSENTNNILLKNQIDVAQAFQTGLENSLIDRLKLTPSKIETLIEGLRQVGEQFTDLSGRVIESRKLSETLYLERIYVPIGLLLIIFESRPDCLIQISALALATGNGVILKGGKEALNTNKYLHSLLTQVLAKYVPAEAISLVDSREEIDELVTMKDHIDLIIPRGSYNLIKSIKEKSEGNIPVMGHSEGICHVYVDSSADLNKSISIVRDSKCNYPAACNAMETLLVHRDHLSSGFLASLVEMLKDNQVILHPGERLASHFQFGLVKKQSMTTEYGRLECGIEIVDDIDDAIRHIDRCGSKHTDVIVTEDEDNSKKFLHQVDSACVFVNCSSRFSDGFRMGLGAEVGISTTKLHARGPVGAEGLMSYKWILRGNSETVEDYETSRIKKYSH